MCSQAPGTRSLARVSRSGRNRVQPTPATSPSCAIIITDHLVWARAIARGVRQAFNFLPRSQEELDLESTAYLAAVELAQRFDPSWVRPGSDPAAAFRGWATIAVRCSCRREARRLRNGGTYHTRRETPGKALIVESLPESASAALIDPRSLIEDETVD